MDPRSHPYQDVTLLQHTCHTCRAREEVHLLDHALPWVAYKAAKKWEEAETQRLEVRLAKEELEVYIYDGVPHSFCIGIAAPYLDHLVLPPPPTRH
jgi:hypothetical protein